MELNGKKTSSKVLLSYGGGGGLSEKFLLKPKTGGPLQTERVPRSSGETLCVISCYQFGFLILLNISLKYLMYLQEDKGQTAVEQQCNDVWVCAFICESVLDRLQSFLPQMAEANEKLRQQMKEAPAGRFDIESVEEAEKVIEMDVALVELDGSDSDEETSDSEDESHSEDDDCEITEQKLKLPGDKKKKANIQVLNQQTE
uniref:NOP protein chaperone 1 n=1 Tax=Acanthochromis polyacanthus TaxID=80966 RepID=A0A3Q1FVR8_9TELE